MEGICAGRVLGAEQSRRTWQPIREDEQPTVEYPTCERGFFPREYGVRSGNADVLGCSRRASQRIYAFW